MESLRPRAQIFREELKKLIGSFVESWPEMNHTTIYYSIKKANLNNEKCTQCNIHKPIIVRYEKDHWSQEFYDIFCESCTPTRILDSLRGKGG